MKICEQCASPTNKGVKTKLGTMCQGCYEKFTERKQVQIIVQDKRAAILDMEGKFLQLLIVSKNFQTAIINFLHRGNYQVSKETAANFPYLKHFV